MFQWLYFGCFRLQTPEGVQLSDVQNKTCYDVAQDLQWVGIVGVATSRKAVMVASLMGIFHIPSIGTLSSSDELSDKTRRVGFFPEFCWDVPVSVLGSVS